jgi:hypothetical protein
LRETLRDGLAKRRRKAAKLGLMLWQSKKSRQLVIPYTEFYF